MKRIITVVFAAILLWSCGNKTQFTINGTVVPQLDGQMIRYSIDKGNPVAVDTVEITKGKFTIKGDVQIPELNLLSILDQNKYVAQFFIEPGKIDMTIYPDSFEANVISGSKSNDIFRTYMDEVISLSKAEGELQKRFVNAQSSGNEEEMSAIMFEYETMIDNTQFYAKNFIKEYSNSPVAAYVYLMNFFQQAELEELDSMLTVFEPIGASDLVIAMKERADQLRVSGIGAEAPDFTLDHLGEIAVSLSSLRGKYVLIDFWASWCQPCMMELPNVIEQYITYKDKGFEIYGVSLDRDGEAWMETIVTKNMDWVNGWDQQGEIATMYGVTGIPTTILLDKEGKILAKNLRGADLKAKLAELLD
ncbi:MAG TPA: TlpA disulfide reductase family protein [Prolixibacteraceae bacterium]|nr:TlpA disulfide reductase family protein [Prolixibacteraceae bacterium]